MEVTRSASGVRRAGDEYQDAVALNYLVEMLEHKSRFLFIKVEATDAGFLDDVVAQYSDNRVDYVQVKHSTYPDLVEDQFDWKTLVERKRGKSNVELPSLLQKWAKSFFVLRQDAAHSVNAMLITNRRPNASVALALDRVSSKIDFSRIPEEVRSTIESQLESDSRARTFFANFSFCFDYPDLETIELSTLTRFHRLGGTTNGWNNLKETLRRWIRDRTGLDPSQEIRIGDARRAALWGSLAGLPQGFPIPPDYVVPLAEMHEELLRRVKRSNEPPIVICGQPGIGKSTYLSYLYGCLSEQNVPTIRHHFFLSMNESRRDRYDHLRVIESLMKDLLERHSEALGDLEVQNPRPDLFEPWLDQCSAFFQKDQEKLVVILDGLDHVWREHGNLDELVLLLELFVKERPGVTLVLGSQPASLDKLPHRISRLIPSEKWMNLPRLSRESVHEWVKFHQQELETSDRLPSSNIDRDLLAIANMLFDLSHGHPLILRYVFQSFLDSDEFPENFGRKFGFQIQSGDVWEYYEYLWSSLSIEARTMLSIMSTIDFSWQRDAVVQCSANFGYSKVSAQRGWIDIEHLLIRDPLGWKFFHSSIVVFVRDQPEYIESLHEARSAVIRWLETDAQELWRWSFLWSAKSENGDAVDLIGGVNREWIIDSLTKGFSYARTKEIVRLAASESIKRQKIPTFVEAALLGDYIESRIENLEDDVRGSWVATQLASGNLQYLSQMLFSTRSQLSPNELASLAQHVSRMGESDWLLAIYDELTDRYRTSEHSHSYSNPLSELEPLVAVETLLPNFDVSLLTSRIKENSKWASLGAYCELYARHLFAKKRVKTLRRLVEAELPVVASVQFLVQLVLLSMEENIDCSREVAMFPYHPFAAIYAKLKDLDGFPPPEPLLADSKNLASRTRIDLDERESLKRTLSETYFNLISLFLWEKKIQAELWILAFDDTTWIGRLVNTIFELAELAARALKTQTQLSLSDFWAICLSLERPAFSNDNPDWEWWQIARKLLPELCLDTLSLANGSRRPAAGEIFVELITSGGIFDTKTWTDNYILRGRKLLAPAELEEASKHFAEDKTRSSEDLADDGVTDNTNMALLLAFHDRPEAIPFLRRAVGLALSYGHRKDTLLSEYIDCVAVVAEKNPSVALQNIECTLTPILSVRQYTDGRETRHVPSVLFDLLASIAPEKLLRIYLHLRETRKHYMADDVIESLIPTMKFSTEVEKQLGSTFLGAKNRELVASLASSGRTDAVELLRLLPRYEEGTSIVPGSQNEASSANSDTVLEETSLDVSIFPPTELASLFKTAKQSGRYDRNEVLSQWILCWEQKLESEVLIEALTSLHLRDNYVDCGWHLYRLVSKAEGHDKAYPWLVVSHNESNGWSTYWRDRRYAVRIWDEIHFHYPERWYQFVEDTLRQGGQRHGGLTVHGRLTRFIEYLVHVGHKGEAIEFLSAATKIIVDLTEPFCLEPQSLPFSELTLGELQLEVLLSRMSWPVGAVKERACTAVARLLISPEMNREASTALLRWISRQLLETSCAIGLLPFLKAKWLMSGVEVPSPDRLIEICSRPSLQYFELLSNLYPQDRRTLPEGSGYSNTEKRSLGPDFRKLVNQNLPGFYEHEADRIERFCRVDFFSRWHAEYHDIDDLHKSVVAEDDSSFHGRGDDKHYAIFDSFVGEKLQSGFLRALAWLSGTGNQGVVLSILANLKATPVDLGLWQTEVQTMPTWWPSAAQTSRANKIDTVPAEIVGAIERLWQENLTTTQRVAMLSGRVSNGPAFYDIEIFALLQKRNGPNVPTGEAIFDDMPWVRQSMRPSILTSKLHGTLRPVSEELSVTSIDDWEVLPCVLPITTHTTPRWQYWRMLRGLYCPNPVLAGAEKLEVRCESDSIEYSGPKERLGIWKDWIGEGVESSTANLTPNTGQYVAIDRTAIANFESSTGATFCWVYQVVAYSRKHSYEKFDRHSFFGVLGGSNVIRPE